LRPNRPIAEALLEPLRIANVVPPGRAHPLRVVAVRQEARSAGPPPPAQAGVVAQFQTCVTLDGSVDRILDAVPV